LTFRNYKISQEYIANVVERMQALNKKPSSPTSPGPKYLSYDQIKQVLFNEVTASGRTKMILLHALRWVQIKFKLGIFHFKQQGSWFSYTHFLELSREQWRIEISSNVDWS
jgi:hypothetical protein